MDKNLLFGALGNGITVFDKTVQDNGDFKKDCQHFKKWRS